MQDTHGSIGERLQRAIVYGQEREKRRKALYEALVRAAERLAALDASDHYINDARCALEEDDYEEREVA